MKKHRSSGWAALVLAVVLCLQLALPSAFAVSGQVKFTGVDTMMIYNPMVDYEDMSYYGTLSTGNMSGQIKTDSGNFSNEYIGGEDIPFRDIGPQLQQELKGFTPVISGPAVETESFDRLMPEVSVGSTKTFFYWPNQAANYKAEKVQFTCAYVGDNCIVWGYDFSDSAMAREMGEEFDDLIYSNNTSYFGTSRFMDQGQKMNILIYRFHENGDDTGVIGFFWGIELHTSGEQGSYAGSYNAGMPIIHINSDICTHEYDYFNRYAAVTVAHEHQHLVCKSSSLLGNGFYYDMGTWLNEAMAKAAEELNYPGMVVSNGYISGGGSGSYNNSAAMAGGQSLYNFDTDTDIGAYGRGFLFSEYIEKLYGGSGVFKEIHDHWRTASTAKLTDAEALYAALPQSVRTSVMNSVDYPATVTAGFNGDADEFLSKLALSFHVAAAVKESSGIYGMPSSCSESSPAFYTGTQRNIECGGRIFVRTRDGNSYTVPSGASDKLIYVGFKNGEMVIAPTTAANYAASAYKVIATTNDPSMGTVSVSGCVITASPAAGYGYASPAYTVVSGTASVSQNGNYFTVTPSSDCTICINFAEKTVTPGVDVWDGSIASSIPVYDDVYTISTCAQLAKLAQMVNSGDDFYGKTVCLVADLDLDDRSWTPIGTASNPFRGSFDGGVHKITGLYINTQSISEVGLFGAVIGGRVMKLNVDESTVRGAKYTGAVVGFLSSGFVLDCNTLSGVSVTSGSYAGGVIGCVIDTGEGSAVGYCYNAGTVSAAGNGTFAGGIVGWTLGGEDSSAIVTYCRNTGSVSNGYGTTDSSYTGGITGAASTAGLLNCYNSGTISGDGPTGGIVGLVDGDAGNYVSYNTGYITNTFAYSGGIVGYLSDGGQVGYSYNAASVTCDYSSTYARGIAGSNKGSVGYCYYLSSTTSDSYATSRTSSQLKDSDYLSYLDFDTEWCFVSGVNSGYPVLQVFNPKNTTGALTFDKYAFSADCKDLTFTFSGYGAVLTGIKDVDRSLLSVASDSETGITTVTISQEYLATLPVGSNTLYVRFAAECYVPVTVNVVDNTPDEFVLEATRARYNDDYTVIEYILSAPEATEVTVVLAAYRDGKMESVDAQTIALAYGRNDFELTLDQTVDGDLRYSTFLATDDGYVPLIDAYSFYINLSNSSYMEDLTADEPASVDVGPDAAEQMLSNIDLLR